MTVHFYWENCGNSKGHRGDSFDYVNIAMLDCKQGLYIIDIRYARKYKLNFNKRCRVVIFLRMLICTNWFSCFGHVYLRYLVSAYLTYIVSLVFLISEYLFYKALISVFLDCIELSKKNGLQTACSKKSPQNIDINAYNNNPTTF